MEKGKPGGKEAMRGGPTAALYPALAAAFSTAPPEGGSQQIPAHKGRARLGLHEGEGRRPPRPKPGGTGLEGDKNPSHPPAALRAAGAGIRTRDLPARSRVALAPSHGAAGRGGA